MNITTAKSIIITQDNAKPLTFQPEKTMREYLQLTSTKPMASMRSHREYFFAATLKALRDTLAKWYIK